MKNLSNDYMELVLKPSCEFVKRHPIATIVYASVCGLACAVGSLAPMIIDKIDDMKNKKEIEKVLASDSTKD